MLVLSNNMFSTTRSAASIYEGLTAFIVLFSFVQLFPQLFDAFGSVDIINVCVQIEIETDSSTKCITIVFKAQTVSPQV